MYRILAVLVGGDLRSTGNLLGKGAELGGLQMYLGDGSESMWLRE